LKKKILKFLLLIVLAFAGFFLFYFNNTNLVNPKTKAFYEQLKETLVEKGYSNRLLVVSTKRVKWHNDFQVKFSSAAKESKHLVGDAIDFLVFDINRDGISNDKDVNIVFDILDKEIIKDKGGIGVYKNEKNFVDRQMIHIDSRVFKARW
jgi:uncharacterized protein YcbK (DUF882 family)